MAKRTPARGRRRSRLPPGRRAETSSRKLQLRDRPCPGSKMAKRTWSVEEPPIALAGSAPAPMSRAPGKAFRLLSCGRTLGVAVTHGCDIDASFRKTNFRGGGWVRRQGHISQNEFPGIAHALVVEAPFRKTSSSPKRWCCPRAPFRRTNSRGVAHGGVSLKHDLGRNREGKRPAMTEASSG